MSSLGEALADDEVLETSNDLKEVGHAKDLWVHLRRLGIPLNSQLAAYPHAEYGFEMVTRKTFEGWDKAMDRLKQLALIGEELVQSHQARLFNVALLPREHL